MMKMKKRGVYIHQASAMGGRLVFELKWTLQ